MKIFVFTVLLLAALIQRISALNINSVEDLDVIVSACEKEEKVSDYYEDTWTVGEVTELLNKKCFMRCLLVKSGLGNDKGEIIDSEVKNAVDELAKSKGPAPYDVAEILRNCASAGTVAEPCEKVYQWSLCVQENIVKQKNQIQL